MILLVAGCGGAAPVRTVTEIIAQCDALKGKPIQAAGYLDACAGYECHLYADKAARDTFGEAWKKAGLAEQQVRRGAKPQDVGFDEAWARVDALWGIGIGGENEFDRKAAPFQHSYVVITGQVAKDTCTGQGGTDRSSGIEPTHIRAWKPSEGAPGNTQ